MMLNSTFSIQRSQRGLPASQASALRAGFTLVEMLVAVSLFTTVMFVAVGSLLSMTAASRKAQSISIVMDNLNFALESMGRTIRAGSVYHCDQYGALTDPNDCASSGADTLAFRSEDGGTFVYRKSGTTLQKSVDGGATFLDITGASISIESLAFYVVGSPAGDGIQPRVLAVVSGEAGLRSKETARFSIQTTISQRIISP